MGGSVCWYSSNRVTKAAASHPEYISFIQRNHTNILCRSRPAGAAPERRQASVWRQERADGHQTAKSGRPALGNACSKATVSADGSAFIAKAGNFPEHT
jgi:hypothetical protein